MTPLSRTAVAEWTHSASVRHRWQAGTPKASATPSVTDCSCSTTAARRRSSCSAFARSSASATGFEDALRERVGALQGFDHPAFSQVRAVERLDSGDLVLVSTVTTGKRASEIFRSGHGRPGVHPAFAAWFIRESVSAIAALQQVDDIAHAALTPDRLILAPNGRLVVVEHVLGAALDRLRAHRQETAGLRARRPRRREQPRAPRPAGRRPSARVHHAVPAAGPANHSERVSVEESTRCSTTSQARATAARRR